MVSIILLTLFGSILFLVLLLLCYFAAIEPIINHRLKKESNRLQWRFIETAESAKNSFKKDCVKEGTLEYRVLPDDLSPVVNIFSENYWREPFDEKIFKFKNEQEFISYVSEKFPTYKSLIDWENIKEHKLWFYPN